MTTNTEEALRKKFVAIAARYLTRTRGEVDDLRKHVSELTNNTQAALKELELLSHRIRGSGAVFGFAKISDVAGEIEMLAFNSMASNDGNAAQLTPQLTQLIDALATEVERANGDSGSAVDP